MSNKEIKPIVKKTVKLTNTVPPTQKRIVSDFDKAKQMYFSKIEPSENKQFKFYSLVLPKAVFGQEEDITFTLTSKDIITPQTFQSRFYDTFLRAFRFNSNAIFSTWNDLLDLWGKKYQESNLK